MVIEYLVILDGRTPDQAFLWHFNQKELFLSQKEEAAEEKEDSDVDLFSDDEAPPAKPAVVKPVSKPAPAVVQQPPKKVVETPVVVEPKVWANKAECDLAEKKHQEKLAQVDHALSGRSLAPSDLRYVKSWSFFSARLSYAREKLAYAFFVFLLHWMH